MPISVQQPCRSTPDDGRSLVEIDLGTVRPVMQIRRAAQRRLGPSSTTTCRTAA